MSTGTSSYSPSCMARTIDTTLSLRILASQLSYPYGRCHLTQPHQANAQYNSLKFSKCLPRHDQNSHIIKS
ncbi:hypothetical protein SDJN03_05540, partial [Cucurbita argyrosperma subsp. sororia]